MVVFLAYKNFFDEDLLLFLEKKVSIIFVEQKNLAILSKTTVNPFQKKPAHQPKKT